MEGCHIILPDNRVVAVESQLSRRLVDELLGNVPLDSRDEAVLGCFQDGFLRMVLLEVVSMVPTHERCLLMVLLVSDGFDPEVVSKKAGHLRCVILQFRKDFGMVT